MQSHLSGFYKKSLEERYQCLQELGWTQESLPQLPIERAEAMVENVLGVFGMSLGLATNFTINGHAYVIPMVVEEPSVVAAASNAAKILGNIYSHTPEKLMIGQVILSQVKDASALIQYVETHQDELVQKANKYAPSMVKRGGGARHFDTKVLEDADETFMSVYLAFDPCDAMGANTINTVLEGIAPQLAAIAQGQVLMAILSNYQEVALTEAQVQVPILSLHDNPQTAKQIAEDIARASRYAQLDPYRATTHNKGVMNGMDAVILATGNDWRAVESGVHAYVGRQGHYGAMTRWWVEEETLCGSLSLPIQVATVGGSIGTHPACQWVLEILQNPSAKELAQIIGAVGLAQNFAALKALVSDGIQKGHMRMHYRNLATQVGAKPEEVTEMVRILQTLPSVNSTIAEATLQQLRHSAE